MRERDRKLTEVFSFLEASVAPRKRASCIELAARHPVSVILKTVKSTTQTKFALEKMRLKYWYKNPASPGTAVQTPQRTPHTRLKAVHTHARARAFHVCTTADTAKTISRCTFSSSARAVVPRSKQRLCSEVAARARRRLPSFFPPPPPPPPLLAAARG